MSEDEFFESQGDQSRAKTEIVSKYFSAWASIVLPHAKRRGENVGFVDLFCGPGEYQDGTYSTPLEVFRIAAQRQELAARLEAHLNDWNPRHVALLRTTIEQIPELRTIKNEPIITNHEVSSALIPTIERAGEIPTLFFVDPWGYKGLSLELFRSALKGWGCDLIFFFNYNRINPALPNSKVDPLIDDLFGPKRASQLRDKLSRTGVTGHDREMLILNEMLEAIREIGGEFVLPFRFRSKSGNRTSHYLVFASKVFRGFHIMKGVMKGVGSVGSGNSAMFELHDRPSLQLSMLDEFYEDQRIDKLMTWLQAHFQGRTVTFDRVYEELEKARKGTAFIESDYRDAINRLESTGAILADPSADKRRVIKGQVTVPKAVKITFP